MKRSILFVGIFSFKFIFGVFHSKPTFFKPMSIDERIQKAEKKKDAIFFLVNDILSSTITPILEIDQTLLNKDEYDRIIFIKNFLEKLIKDFVDDKLNRIDETYEFLQRLDQWIMFFRHKHNMNRMGIILVPLSDMQKKELSDLIILIQSII